MVFHQTLYKSILSVMIRELVVSRTIMLNWYPAKNGISKYYSPMTIVTGWKLDYKKHCTIEFGAYVQAHNKNEPSNTNTERSLDGIYMRSNENIQGDI